MRKSLTYCRRSLFSLPNFCLLHYFARVVCARPHSWILHARKDRKFLYCFVEREKSSSTQSSFADHHEKKIYLPLESEKREREDTNEMAKSSNFYSSKIMENDLFPPRVCLPEGVKLKRKTKFTISNYFGSSWEIIDIDSRCFMSLFTNWSWKRARYINIYENVNSLWCGLEPPFVFDLLCMLAKKNFQEFRPLLSHSLCYIAQWNLWCDKSWKNFDFLWAAARFTPNNEIEREIEATKNVLINFPRTRSFLIHFLAKKKLWSLSSHFRAGDKLSGQF